MYWALYIPSCLATITNGVLVSRYGTMTLTSRSSQWYERGQEPAFDPTALARPLQSGYSFVHGRLKTSKMEIETWTSPPPALKQIFGKTNHVGVFGGSLWTFSHREIQINRTLCFLLLCVIFLKDDQFRWKWRKEKNDVEHFFCGWMFPNRNKYVSIQFSMTWAYGYRKWKPK